MADIVTTVHNSLDMMGRLMSPSQRLLLELAKGLAMHNPFMTDLMFKQANQGKSHTIGRKHGKPQVYLVQEGTGPYPSKISFDDMSWAMAKIASMHQYTPESKKEYSFSAQVIAENASDHMNSISERWGEMLLYGSRKKDRKEFNGILTIMNSTAAPNVMDFSGGSASGTDNTTILFVKHDMNGIYGIYPDFHTTTTGFSDAAFIEGRVASAGGITTYYTGDMHDMTNGYTNTSAFIHSSIMGFVLARWENVYAIRNIDMTKVTSDPATGDLFAAFDIVENKMGNYWANTVCYMHRNVMLLLKQQLKKQDKLRTDYIDYINGMKVNVINGIPCYQCDFMSVNEQAVGSTSVPIVTD